MNAPSAKPGLVELLESAAAIIEREAAIIKQSHVTASGRWSATSPFVADARACHDDMLRVGNGLRLARAYQTANVFGGPAARFDAIADLIRAGDSVDLAMRVFGVAWVKNGARGNRYGE